MRDEATLVRQAEKLINALQHPDAAFKAVVNTVRQSSADIVVDLATAIRATAHKLLRSEARIAELEAELDHQRSWRGAAYEYEEQARFARAERDIALARIAELEAERDREPGWLTGDFTVNKLKARIAELEAEVARQAKEIEFLNDVGDERHAEKQKIEAEVRSLNIALTDTINGKNHDIAELEAEVARLRPGDAAERYWEARWRDCEAEREKWHSDAVTQMQHKIRLEAEIARLNSVVAHEMKRSAEEVGRIGAENDRLKTALTDMLRYYEPYAQDFAPDEPVSLAWDAAIAALSGEGVTG